jgi:lantibiotic modifying enzyme
MTFSAAEIEVIIKAAADSGDSSARARWRAETRRLLQALPDFEFPNARATPLGKLCAAGARYGWHELERNAPTRLLALLSGKAKASLRRNLQRDLEWITRPSFALEWKSFGLAVAAIGLATAKPDQTSIEKTFLRDRPSHRLFSLFQKFPILAGLWSQTIQQWRTHVHEVLVRFAQDRAVLSRTFFRNRPPTGISDAHFGLSDRHHAGRTVVRLQFDDHSIIYKPRTGAGESEWFSFLGWMNRRGFHPSLRTVRVLPRKNYCWMEYVGSGGSLGSEAAALRFYERMGGIIAAAYLLKAVDCHRDNLIAAGEDPVLVDADAMWHVSPSTNAQSLTDLLYRTGFFPNARPGSLQSRSSALGPGTAGKHQPRLHGRPLKPDRYRREMARGFARAWKCILGTPSARVGFARRLQHIRLTERRWLYRATEIYAAIREASIQPPALRSHQDRERLVRQQCRRNEVAPRVIEAEVRALKQLDIPYFTTRKNRRLLLDQSTVPSELMKALSTMLPTREEQPR